MLLTLSITMSAFPQHGYHTSYLFNQLPATLRATYANTIEGETIIIVLVLIAEHQTDSASGIGAQTHTNTVIGPPHVSRQRISAWHLRYVAPENTARLPQLAFSDLPVRRPSLISFIDKGPPSGNQKIEWLV